MANPPPGLALAALIGPTTKITRRVDIYEEDAVTPFMLDAPFLDGSVSVDGTRDERRTLDMSFENIDGSLDNYPGGFWYDKVIKPYRGLTWEGRTASWVEFDATNTLGASDNPNHNPASGILRVRMKVSMADWTPAAAATIAGKNLTTGNQRQWRLVVNTSGTLSVIYSTTGSAGVTIAGATPVAVANGQVAYIGFDFLINNGAGGKTVQFLQSADGIVWSTLGDPVVEGSTGTTALFDAATSLTVGGAGFDVAPAGTKIYWFAMYDDERTITYLDLENLENGQPNMLDSSEQVWSFSNGTSKVKGGVIEEQSWEVQLGEFLLDRIDSDNFPNTVGVTGRDRSKALIESEYTEATTFQETETPEDVIRAIATSGNVTRWVLPYTGQTLGRDYTFESGTKRWEAIKQIALAFNYEVFFDNTGYLVMQPQQDPVTSAVAHTFEAGEYGNLVKWSKSSSDTLIKNQVAVRGEATDVLPVSFVAENHEPSSPTSIENLNRIKTHAISSPFITTEAQAQALAESLLKVMGLEAFDVNITSLVFPWLEAHQVVEFLDPNPNMGDPTRYLLSSMTIPLSLAAMTAVARRVTLVG